METRIINVQKIDEASEAFEEAAGLIRKGELVAFPTETVYGLGGDGLNPEAAAKIYSAKGRPSDNPLILHICDLAMLEPLVQSVSVPVRVLAGRFWPGPLTIILPKTDIVPKETTGGLETVAIRFPSHPAARRLIRMAGVPIAAPSANRSGRPSPTRAAHVFQDLDGRIPLILDGGDCEIGLESTIVDMTGPVPLVLRPGYISFDDLRTVLGTVAIDPAVFYGVSDTVKPKAPGMKYRHYAPNVPIHLVEGPDGKRAAYILRKAGEDTASGKRIGILCSRETACLYGTGEANILLLPLGTRNKPETIAGNLFAALRGLDDLPLDAVYSETFPEGELGAAIMNRLEKAAGHDITMVD